MKAKLTFQLPESVVVSPSSDQTSYLANVLQAMGTSLATGLIVSDVHLRVIKRDDKSPLSKPVRLYRFGASIHPSSRTQSWRDVTGQSISTIMITLRSFLSQANPLRARSRSCREHDCVDPCTGQP